MNAGATDAALEALASPFSMLELEWRVVRLSEDRLSALVRPQLRLAAVLARLDETVGVGGWSNLFTPLGEGAVSCTLSALGVSKSAVAVRGPQGDLVRTSEDALVYAAERFGLRPPVPDGPLPWVDYDPEAGTILYEPEVQRSEAQVAQDAPEPPRAEPATPLAESPPPPKPAGQRAIDRLLERLKEEGLGLQAAKLVVRYGGYGSDPQAARELYAKLRELLLKKPTEADD